MCMASTIGIYRGVSAPFREDTPHALADDLYVDIMRTRDDIGFHLGYDVERAVKDYVAWLKTGNER